MILFNMIKAISAVFLPREPKALRGCL